MPGLRWGAALVVLVVACQAPAPVTPTPVAPTAVVVSTPVAPTPAPGAPPSVAASRVETLNAASAALRSGDLKTAAGLYERVLNTPAGSTEGPAAVAINDFAHFRAMVTLLADGREDEARIHLDALQSRD